MSEGITAELWDPLLANAFTVNELPRGLSRLDTHAWLGGLAKMVIRGLEDGEATSSATGPYWLASSPCLCEPKRTGQRLTIDKRPPRRGAGARRCHEPLTAALHSN